MAYQILAPRPFRNQLRPVRKNSQQRLYDGPKVAVQLFGALSHLASDPPEHHLYEAAGDVVDQKVLRDGPRGLALGALLEEATVNRAKRGLKKLIALAPTTGALVHNADSCFVVLLAALLYDRKFQ